MRPQRSPLPEGAETWVTCSHSGASQACLNEVRSPKERRRRGIVWSIRMIESASTKSAPRRSGDLTRINDGGRIDTPQRSPLPEGAETCSAGEAGDGCWPQRSPLPEGAETHVSVSVVQPEGPASTKSAPRRSGDCRMTACSGYLSSASTKSAPRRSGDTSGRLQVVQVVRGLNEVRSPKERRRAHISDSERLALISASTKSAPRRSGDCSAQGLCSRGRVASTKSAPRRSGDNPTGIKVLDSETEPQRSPLPEGAETRLGPTGGRCSLRLNEVRSPKERRPIRDAIRDGMSMPQRSPLPEGAETAPQYRRL